MFTRKTFVLLLSATVCGALAQSASADEGVKGLFYEQLQQPAAHLNTGVRYWIELNRDGKTLRVNNKTVFHNGDKIRFHVTPNIDGYAYVVLKEGSAGEQAVLFPEANHSDDTHIKRGNDYILPSDGYLTFDQNPGLEKVSVLLSRTPMDAQAYLQDKGKERVLVASAGGSKDLFSDKVLVAYEPWESAFKPHVERKQARKAGVASAHKSVHKARLASGVVGRPLEGMATVVTVVHTDPTGVLALDVDLDHEK